MDQNHLIARCGESPNVLNCRVAKREVWVPGPVVVGPKGGSNRSRVNICLYRRLSSPLVHHTFSTKPPKTKVQDGRRAGARSRATTLRKEMKREYESRY